ncbi:hypothetical protein PENTCL1PPCAC_12246, partial [Pristionchus entomophagus]
PSNIAVNERCQVKILDFGLARLFEQAASRNMTAYVVTRFYRAPEVVVGLPYSEKVDVWSIGCIFAEMITGQLLFDGGDNSFHQWEAIIKIVGTPSEQYISQIKDEATS